MISLVHYITLLSVLVVDLIEAEEDEVSSSLPDKPRPYRKASSELSLLGITRTFTLLHK